MKNSYLYLCLLLICNFGKTISNEVSIVEPTSYSRSYLMNIKERKLCKSDEDCPSFTYCTIGLNQNYCQYNSFICPEDENTNCQYINSTIWNEKVEDIYYRHLSDIFSGYASRPIMKTCTKEQVDAKECKTKKCINNEDCFSGLCYSNTCATEQMMYVCEGGDEEDHYLLRCKKRNNMRCDSDEECISSECYKGYCKKCARRDYSIKDFIISIIIYFIILPGPLYIIINSLIKFGIIKDPKEIMNKKN